MLAQQSSKADEVVNSGNEDNAGVVNFKIGVAEYYIAKRAGRKLKAFWLRHKDKQAEEKRAEIAKEK